jgi:cytochrome c oxidase assembly factor 5
MGSTIFSHLGVLFTVFFLHTHTRVMPTSCRTIRKELADCLLQSDCMLKHRHKAKECLQDPNLAHLVPERCQAIRKSFFECRRGLLDMRLRFRGNRG